jgi:hypothetical protein
MCAALGHVRINKMSMPMLAVEDDALVDDWLHDVVLPRLCRLILQREAKDAVVLLRA